MSALPLPATTTGLEDLTGDYRIDPAHTRIGFGARYAMVTKVRGRFGDVDGHVHLDGRDPARSRATLTITAASIDTGNETRDDHLRSNDFFAMGSYPELRFASTAIEPLDGPTFRVTGDLTIKGTTRPISFTLEYTGAAVDADGHFRVGFEGSTVIDRRDWGVTWNAALDNGGVLVSERIGLELEVSMVRT